jgi:hypothetical protein
MSYLRLAVKIESLSKISLKEALFQMFEGDDKWMALLLNERQIDPLNGAVFVLNELIQKEHGQMIAVMS